MPARSNSPKARLRPEPGFFFLRDVVELGSWRVPRCADTRSYADLQSGRVEIQAGLIASALYNLLTFDGHRAPGIYELHRPIPLRMRSSAISRGITGLI